MAINVLFGVILIHDIIMTTCSMVESKKVGRGREEKGRDRIEQYNSRM